MSLDAQIGPGIIIINAQKSHIIQSHVSLASNGDHTEAILLRRVAGERLKMTAVRAAKRHVKATGWCMN